MIGNVQTASPDALSGATSLLAALADPQAAQKKLDDLKSATDQYNAAREAALAAQKELDVRAKELASLDQETYQRRDAVKVAESALTDRSAALDTRESGIQSRSVAFEARVSSLTKDLDARELVCSQRENDATAKEQTLTARESALVSSEEDLAVRVAKLKAALL